MINPRNWYRSLPGYARERRICIQPRPSRACRKKRLKKGKGFFAWPRGKEPDCNSLRYYTRSLNSQQPPPPKLVSFAIIYEHSLLTKYTERSWEYMFLKESTISLNSLLSIYLFLYRRWFGYRSHRMRSRLPQWDSLPKARLWWRNLGRCSSRGQTKLGTAGFGPISLHWTGNQRSSEWQSEIRCLTQKIMITWCNAIN